MPVVVFVVRPPNWLSKSDQLSISTASFVGPWFAQPTNAAMDVATPVMV
jgi:hypothetical protein